MGAIGTLSADSVAYSIIVVNYNGGSLLANCIDSVGKHTANYEIILIDNDSVNKSLSLMEPGSDLQI